MGNNIHVASCGIITEIRKIITKQGAREKTFGRNVQYYSICFNKGKLLDIALLHDVATSLFAGPKVIVSFRAVSGVFLLVYVVIHYLHHSD